ncbi:hypothetical protein ACFX2G_035085 [Malus domestica]
MATTTPGEDDMELERQLQSLNKPIVKTFQLRPTSFPAETQKSAPAIDPISETLSKMEACPEGTVPIPRTTKDDLVMAKSLSHQMFCNALSPNTHQVFVRINQKAGVTYYGLAGICSIYKLPSSPDWSSTSNVWVEGAPQGNYNVLIAGVMVSQPINSDDIPRLFVYWDPVSENWWLQIGAKSNITVGYWPKEIVPGLLNGAEDAGWGGIAMTKENEDSPPMGGGQFPDGFYDHAAYFKEVRYMLKGLEQVIPTYCDSFTEHADGTGCYALQNDKDTWLEGWRYRFLFGGPGGNCGT